MVLRAASPGASLESNKQMIQYLYLGRVDYAEALRLQEELVALRQQGCIGNVLLLLEHTFESDLNIALENRL